MYHEYYLMFHYLLATLRCVDGANSVTTNGTKLFDVVAGIGQHRWTLSSQSLLIIHAWLLMTGMLCAEWSKQRWSLVQRNLEHSGLCAPPGLPVSIMRIRQVFWQFVFLLLAFMFWDAKLGTFYFQLLCMRSGWITQCVDAAVDWSVICFFHFNRCLEAGIEWFCGFWCCFQFSIALPEYWNNVEIFWGCSRCLSIAIDLK